MSKLKLESWFVEVLEYLHCCFLSGLLDNGLEKHSRVGCFVARWRKIKAPAVQN